MANLASLIVKIGAQDTEISAALEKLIGNARRSDAELQKLGSQPLAQQAIRDTAKLAENIKQITDAQQNFANKAVAAATGVETLGGAARLMSRELDQVNRTLQTGLDAFRALGQEAPKDLQRVADAVSKQQAALKQASGSTTQLTGSSNALAGAQGALLTVVSRLAGPAALGLAAKQALDYADNLTKLSDRTGIGVVALQRLDAIAGASGNSLEDIAGAVNRFQKGLAEGDQSAVTAIRRLGLSLDDLRQKSPDEQFIAIAKAIQRVPDPANQAALAMELFGKSGAQLLPTLKGDIDALADSTVKMSAESVKALDDFGDALGQLKTSAVNIAGEILGAFLRTAGGIKDAAKIILEAGNAATGGPAVTTPELLQTQPRFASSRVGAPQPRPPLPLLGGITLQLPGAELGGAIQALSGLPLVASQSAVALALVHDRMRALAAAAQALGLETEDYEKKLDAVNAKIVAAERDTGHLSDTQKISVLRYQQLGLAAEDISIKLGISALAVKDFEEEMAEGAARRARQTQETGKFQQELGKLIVGFDASGKAVIGFHGILHTDFDLPLEGSITTLQIATRAMEQLVAVQQRSRGALLNQLAGTIGLPDVKPINKDLLDAARATRNWSHDVDDLSRAFSQLAQVSDGALGDIVREIGNIVAAFDLAIKSAAAFKKAKEDESRSGQAVALLSGGAAVLQATGTGSTAGRTFGGALTGAELGSAFGPIGAGIGAAAGGLIGFFRGLGNSPEKQINPIRQAFVDAAGGLAKLNEKAFAATGSLTLVQNLLNARNLSQYTTAENALTAALQHQQEVLDKEAQALSDLNSEFGDVLNSAQNIGIKLPQSLSLAIQKLVDTGKITGDTADLFRALSSNTEVDFKKMSDVAGKYGIDLASLGPQFQSARLHASAQTIIDDFDLLTQNGADVGGVLFGMRASISGLVQDSIKFGTTIPENMRPWIEELARSGNLVDENGDKITDLSNLKFGDAVKTEFQKIVDKLQELIDKIVGSNGLTAAINRIPTDVSVGVHFNVDTPNLGFPGEEHRAATGGLVTPNGIQRFAGGGVVLPFVPRGTDTVRAMLTPGELVLNAAQQGNLAASLQGGGGGGPISLTFVLPPGNYNDPQALARGLLQVLVNDTGFVRTGIENLIDRRIA